VNQPLDVLGKSMLSALHQQSREIPELGGCGVARGILEAHGAMTEERANASGPARVRLQSIDPGVSQLGGH
jgi:hypothetical protein